MILRLSENHFRIRIIYIFIVSCSDRRQIQILCRSFIRCDANVDSFSALVYDHLSRCLLADKLADLLADILADLLADQSRVSTQIQRLGRSFASALYFFYATNCCFRSLFSLIHVVFIFHTKVKMFLRIFFPKYNFLVSRLVLVLWFGDLQSDEWTVKRAMNIERSREMKSPKL